MGDADEWADERERHAQRERELQDQVHRLREEIKSYWRGAKNPTPVHCLTSAHCGYLHNRKCICLCAECLAADGRNVVQGAAPVPVSVPAAPVVGSKSAPDLKLTPNDQHFRSNLQKLNVEMAPTSAVPSGAASLRPPQAPEYLKQQPVPTQKVNMPSRTRGEHIPPKPQFEYQKSPEVPQVFVTVTPFQLKVEARLADMDARLAEMEAKLAGVTKSSDFRARARESEYCKMRKLARAREIEYYEMRKLLTTIAGWDECFLSDARTTEIGRKTFTAARNMMFDLFGPDFVILGIDIPENYEPRGWWPKK